MNPKHEKQSVIGHTKNANVDAGRRDLHCLDREDRRQISPSRLTYARQRCLRRRVLLRNRSTKKGTRQRAHKGARVDTRPKESHNKDESFMR